MLVEKGELKFELVVEKGVIQKEEGYFFQAGPFDVKVGDQHYFVTFKREGALVLFDVVLDKKSVCHLKFPDYAPECDVEDVEDKGGLSMGLVEALTQLKVINRKDYHTYFEKNAGSSYSVRQLYFL